MDMTARWADKQNKKKERKKKIMGGGGVFDEWYKTTNEWDRMKW